MDEHDAKFAKRDGRGPSAAGKRQNAQRGDLWPKPLAYADLIYSGCHLKAKSKRSTSDMIARMFMAIFEGELGDAGFVEFAQAFRDHAVVLFLGRARER